MGSRSQKKKTLGRWGAVLKDNSCQMLRPETPPVAFYRVGSAGPQAGLRLLSHPPPHLQRKPWSCHRRKEADVY